LLAALLPSRSQRRPRRNPAASRAVLGGESLVSDVNPRLRCGYPLAHSAVPGAIRRKSPPRTAARASLKFQRLKSRKNFWDAYRSFRDQFDLSKLAIEPEVFAGVRDKSPGREVNL